MKDRLGIRGLHSDQSAAASTGIYLRRVGGSFVHCDAFSAEFFGVSNERLSDFYLKDIPLPKLVSQIEALDEICHAQPSGVLELDESSGLDGAYRITQELLKAGESEGFFLGEITSLSELQNHHIVGQWEWNIAADVVKWSSEAMSILEIDADETPSFQQYSDRIDPDDRERVLGTISACLYRNKPYQLEHRLRLPSGKVCKVELGGEMEAAPDGRSQTMLGVLRSANETPNACRELAECPGLIDHLPEAVFWVDPADGAILDVNKPACLFMDMSRHQLLSRNFSELLTSGDWKFLPEEIQNPHHPNVRFLECDLRRANDQSMPVEVNVKLMRQRGKDRVLAVVRNISQRRELQNSLRESEAFKSDVLLDIPQLVARWTRAGRLIYANDAFCRVFDSSLDALIGRAINEFVWESELPSLENALSYLETSDAPQEVELRDAGNSDSERWFRWRIRRLSTEDGRALGIQTVATEIPRDSRGGGRNARGNERLRIAFQDANDQPALMCNSRFQSLARSEQHEQKQDGQFIPRSLSDLDRLLHDEDRYALNLRLAERYQRGTLAAMPLNRESAAAEKCSAKGLGRYQSLFYYASEAMLLHTLDGEIVEANARAASLLGVPVKQLQRSNVMGLPEKREQLGVRLAFDELMADGRVQFESRIIGKGGRGIPVEISSSLIRMEDATYVQTVLRDITLRKDRESQMELSAKVFETTNEAVLITDKNGDIITVNKSFSRIYQYAAHEVRGCNPRILKSGKQSEAFYAEMWSDLKRNGFWQGELWNRRKSGEDVPVWESINAVKDTEGNVTHYVAVVADISILKRAQDENDYLAYHDPLTGLPNRLLFNEQVMHALQHCKRERSRLAVMFMDLDRFKNINDTFGHPVGDEVLRLVSQRIREVLREEDVIARIGGDEFILLLEHIRDVSDVAVVARKILGCFSKPFLVSGKELYITSSMGVSVYPEDGDDVASLVKNADTAMYQAKARGRNDYRFYTEDLAIDPSEHLFLETGLRQALGRGELDVYYQPQIALDTGKIIGAEALVRWRHPEKGLMTPEYFIPIAEETGLIVPIGLWVLSEACAQAKRWHDEGYPLGRISVNLSTIQVQRGDIVSSVAQVLRRTGLNPEFLELEITENFLLEDSDQSMTVLQGLRDLGVKLAIDDFGTGYSNLAYLKSLPVNKLKIDKSFIRDMHSDQNDEDIVRAVIALAKSLHLKLVAEGIEEEQQLQFLMAEGCHEGQGYYYSGPVPAEHFPDLFRRFCGAELNLYPLDSPMH